VLKQRGLIRARDQDEYQASIVWTWRLAPLTAPVRLPKGDYQAAFGSAATLVRDPGRAADLSKSDRRSVAARRANEAQRDADRMLLVGGFPHGTHTRKSGGSDRAAILLVLSVR